MDNNSYNLLHTYSKWAINRQYPNHLNIGNLPDTNTNLKRQISILKEKENQFYSMLLGEKVKDFNDFLNKIKDKTISIQPCLERLSSYNKKNGLKRYVLNNIEISSDLSNGPKNITQTERLKGKTAQEIKSSIVLDTQVLLTNGTMKIKFFQRGDGGKSRQKTKDVKSAIASAISAAQKELKKELLTLADFEEEVIPRAVEPLRNELGKEYNVSVPQLLGSFKNFLIADIINYTGNDKELANAIFDQTVQLQSQNSFFTAKKNIKRKDKVKEVLYQYLSKGISHQQDFSEAFNKAWGCYGEDIVNSLYVNGDANFVGTLGELGGLILLYYLHPTSTKTKWTGPSINDYGEQMRADIVFEEIMGIQVKNYKENTVKNFPVSVRLHPKELMDRLVEGGLSNKGAMEEMLVNMAFNKDIAEHYEDQFKEILQYYMGSVLNFSLDTRGENFQDTSNIWLVGNMIIPASAILQAFLDTYKQIDHFKIDLSFPSDRQDDKGFHRIENRDTPPLYKKYWAGSYGNWTPIKDTQEEEYNNLLNSRNTSIITKFNFYRIFQDNLKNFTFI